MHVMHQDAPRSHLTSGLSHRVLDAPRLDGLVNVELWNQVVEPGAETPVHWHECAEAVVVLSGTGDAISERGAVTVSPGMALSFEPGEIHQIVNREEDPVELVAILGERPARTFTLDGELLDPTGQAGGRRRSGPDDGSDILPAGGNTDD